MQQYLEILQTCRLFAEIPPDSLKTMLECFAPTIQTYAKQQTLLQAGEPLHHLGIVLTGKVQLVRLDYDGNRSITASLSPAQPFGEAFVCAGVDAAPISVIAATFPTGLALQPQKARFYGWRGKSFCIPAAMPAVFTSSCYSMSFNCWQEKMFCFIRNSKSRQNVPLEKNCLLISFSRRSRKTAILL